MRHGGLAAAKSAGEKAWPLPMFPLYGEMIKSEVADIKNTGGSRYGGAITNSGHLLRWIAQRMGHSVERRDSIASRRSLSSSSVEASGGRSGRGALIRRRSPGGP